MTLHKVKDCKQQGLCPFYGNCKFGHDANKCRIATDHEDAAVEEID